MTDTVWSVNILLGVGMIGVIWYIYHILTIDINEEKKNSTISDSTSSTDS